MQVCQLHCTSHQYLSTDKILDGVKCHSTFTKYLPKRKHYKWYIKFWTHNSGIRYFLRSQCYQDEKCEYDEAKIKKNGLAYVVTKLLRTGNYPIKDYQVINDNSVTSVPLAINLYQPLHYM
jgi:hypothetical protein